MSLTNEPEKVSASGGRFVLLYHTWPQPHYDLMLEWQGVLKTWRLAELPYPGIRLTIEAIGDHRLAYLDYEGPVSGNRGKVRRIDSGTYNGDLSIRDRPVRIVIHGQRMQGTWELSPLPESGLWELCWLSGE